MNGRVVEARVIDGEHYVLAVEYNKLLAENALLRGPEKTVTSARGEKPFAFMSKDPCRNRLCEVTYAAPVRVLIAERDELRAAVGAFNAKPELAVWYGPMPESNGKSNFTALLHRKGESLLRGTTITIDRSEYPDRVRYEADRVRYLLGELDVEPCILDYDTDLHSGYGKDRPAPAMKELVEALKDYMAGDIGVSCQRGIVIRCQCQGCRFTRAATAIAKFTEGA